MEIESKSYLITLPLIPSRQGRGNELLDRLFIPARNLVHVFDRPSVYRFVDHGVIRRSGGDKPRRYIFVKSF